MKLECVPDVIELLVEDIIPADALTPQQYTLVSVSEKLKEKGLALPKRQSLSVLQSPVVHTEAAAVKQIRKMVVSLFLYTRRIIDLLKYLEIFMNNILS